MSAVSAMSAMFVTSAAAQEAAPAEFEERISVMAIEIPVRVMVRGRPLAGLTAEDFEVREGAARHEIVAFEAVNLRTAGGSEADGVISDATTLLPGDGRRLLFLFDTAFSNFRPLLRAADGARELVEQGLHPADQVAVAVYSGLRGLTFVSGFTHERPVTLAALDGVRAAIGGDRTGQLHALARMRRLATAAEGSSGAAPASLRRFRSRSAQFGRLAAIVLESADSGLGRLGGVTPGGGAGGAFIPPAGGRLSSVAGAVDPATDRFQVAEPGQIAAGQARGPARSAIRSLSRELAEMATVLRDLPGQKHLYFLSEGFGPALLSDPTALFHLQTALEGLRRANWVVQSIDIGGVPTIDEAAFAADSLFYLANETGGEMIENHNDIGRAAAKLMERTAVSYVLTVQPTDVLADGGYRPLEVRLTKNIPGARLHHRPGYYAPKPLNRRNTVEKALDAASLLLSEAESKQLDVSVLTLPLMVPASSEASEAAGVEVPVVFEVPAESLAVAGGSRRRRSAPRLEFHGYALDESGALLDFFSQTVRLGSREAARLAASGGGIRFYDRVSLPPGRHRLRVLVRDLRSGLSYLATLPLEDVAAAPEPELHPPLFVPADEWVIVRGRGSLNGGRDPRDHPFVLAGQPRIPSPYPVLRPTETTTVLLKATALEGPDLRVSTRVLGRDGRTVDGGALAFTQRVIDETGRFDALLATFSPAGLAPGPYRLEVTASWSGGTRKTVSSSEFRVFGSGG